MQKIATPRRYWAVQSLKDHRISAKGCQLITRAAKWATKQVGIGRTVSEVAEELHCGWDAVNAVMIYGKALLEADHKRLKNTEVLGLDETLFVRTGKYKSKQFATTVADVGNGQLIDVLPPPDYTNVSGWIRDKPAAWKDRV